MKTGPLIQKLKFKPGQRPLIYNAGPEYLIKFESLSPETKISGSYDFAVLFVSNKKELNASAGKLLKGLKESSIFWVAFPKKSSNIQTDLTMYDGWDILKNHQFEGIALVSIDDTWSAMRFRPSHLVAKGRSPGTKKTVSEFIDMKKRKVKVPDELQSKLSAHPKLRTFFQNLAFSHRKEYVEWIVSAKKKETRQIRIRKTIDMLKAGLKNPADKKSKRPAKFFVQNIRFAGLYS